MEKYSVLMSVYANDNPEYFKLAVESMLGQTVPPEQFVMVVDGPVNGGLEDVISEYEGNGKLFTVVRLAENGGAGNALNNGLEQCSNELVAIMDADDISLPMRCERELEMFEKDGSLDVCGCNIDEFYDVPENVRTSRVVPETDLEIKKYMRRRQPFNHGTIMYKKSKVIENGGYITLKRKMDFDLFSRMLSNGCNAANIGESLYLYRVDERNYARRKSWQNFKCALYVYGRHLKRKGCSVVDYAVMCGSELVFFILPYKLMKLVSDRVLRVRK